MLIGLGCDCQISVNQGGTYQSMGLIQDFDLPAPAGTKVLKSWMLQPDLWERNRPGMIDPGELQETFIFSAAMAANILSWLMVEDSYFLFIFSDKTPIQTHGTEWAFLGFIMKPWGGKVAMKEGITQSLTIALSGPISITPAA